MIGDMPRPGEPSFLEAEVPWQGIAPQARIVWGLAGSVVIGVVFVVLAAGVAVAGAGATGAAAVLIVGGALVGLWWWLAGRRYRAWGYAERDVDLLLRRGVMFRRLTIVPYGRMQFVDVSQGPLARSLGLATVKLHTAAAASDAEIPMLDEPEARRLRDRLTALGEAHAAGV